MYQYAGLNEYITVHIYIYGYFCLTTLIQILPDMVSNKTHLFNTDM